MFDLGLFKVVVRRVGEYFLVMANTLVYLICHTLILFISRLVVVELA